MWATVSRRQYLLKMKAKYAGIDYLVSGCHNSHLAFCLHADGQKIAKKLCKGI